MPAVENFGQLDVMYNNAGVVGALGPISTTPAESGIARLTSTLTAVFTAANMLLA